MDYSCSCKQSYTTCEQKLIRVVLQPCLKWNLQLTTPLDKAYRSSRITQCVHWDQQVAMVECLRLVVLCLDSSTKLGFQRTLGAFGPEWVVCLLWLAALQSPVWYAHFRTPLLTCMRLAMVLATTLSNTQLKDQIYADTPFTSAKLTLLTRLLLFPHIFSVVLEACSCPSVMLQALVVALKAVWLLASPGAQELIQFGRGAEYEAAAAELNHSWSSLLLPALPLDVPAHSRLMNRSPQLFLALTTLYSTTAALLVYATYLSCWAQLRSWLRSKMQEATESGGSYLAFETVSVSHEDLQALHTSSTAAAVLDPFSCCVDQALSAMLHVMMLGLVCQFMLFISKFAVFQLLPRLLPEQLFDVYYPLCPEGGCAAVTSAVQSAWGFETLDSTQVNEWFDGSWWVFLC